MKLRWHPGVADDIFSAAAYLLGERDEAARRFAASVEQTLKELTTMPGMGSRKEYLSPRLREVPTWRVKRFHRYLIYYLPLPDGIDVLAVLHGARDAEAILLGRCSTHSPFIPDHSPAGGAGSFSSGVTGSISSHATAPTR